ncbi:MULTISPECIES: 2-amino-4-hydroxy-6-hydroxymethyldihydropteridine diphosphokinase [Aerococcus]|uniref:2-amino-4-hydroxy-6- hydroxymethyldihydropteridine diphosphokinase n=1 Tax=Aerococcus TaxID=1375 RepID=UPI000200EC0D|nr:MULTISPECIES: 2-amino-4-hydroxy-6-hydroxymethyldihydropteridine diphosphokinase [Aerococcus]AEA00283.1 2-amino-4-hydroxy-6-hydroxymethyldihydropteridine diphosphokinase [Aerococcus sp. Group 1]MCY3030493.1 2-amino-4-hydroxy-6-hydroxymethyldihydropteridine diphosphokinase [Aerococcus sp. Group 1]MCY3054535.1 2-amino-4-hydroxy-6-hydroxymethyldihydropteridine diphosphokinase [Aerococcus sp. Group 1]MCY3056265.1 2-amino-4-hydroxy-6-hydroxymethyldihydropteridine diphosphokinase [Aerococcus sp. Gr
MKTTVYLAIGSNIGELSKNLDQAVQAVDALEGTKVTKRSANLSNAAYGVTDQDDFLNGVIEIITDLAPLDLLKALKQIEKEMGRTETYRWGPRLIDIDIIFYGDKVLNSQELTIPHIDMVNRDFVLGPLKEIAPNKKHPIYKKTVSELYQDLIDRNQ